MRGESRNHARVSVIPGLIFAILAGAAPLRAGLQIEIHSDSPDPVVAGNSLTYTVKVANRGLFPPIENVTLRDTFPSAVTVGSVPGGCSVGPPNVVTCGLGLLAWDQTATRTFTVTVNSNASGTLTNTVRAWDISDKTSTQTTTVIPVADIRITKTDGLTSATPGQSLTYTIVASNAGPGPAASVSVSDSFPGPLTCTRTASASGGASGYTSGSGNLNNTLWMPAASAVTYTATCAIDPAATATLTNTATISSAAVSDPNPGNNSATDANTGLAPKTDLALVIADVPDPVVAGTQLTYTFTVTNNGPSTSTSSTVSNPLPAGLNFVSSPSGCTPSGGTVTCPVSSLGPGASQTRSFVAAVASSLTGTIVSNATLSAAQTDPVAGNNSATASTTVNTEADLTVTKDDGLSTAVPGQTTINYSIVAANAGPSDAPSVSLTDVFPAALTCSWTSVAAGGATGGSSGSGNLGDTLAMPASSSVTYAVTCTIDPGATGTLANTATISSGVTDPNPGNNSATDGDTVLIPQTDLVLSKSDAPDPVIAGTQLAYAFTMTNSGPSNSTGGSLSDPLPAGLSFVSSADGCTSSGGTVTCPMGALGVGASQSSSFVVAVASSYTGTLTNTATLSTNEIDPVTANNSATAGTAVDTEADLGITKDDGLSEATPGLGLTYTVVARNHGPSDSPSTSLDDVFPAALTCGWTSVATGGATGNTSATGDLNETLSMPAGSTVTYTVSCAIDSAATGTLVNTATISSPVTDPDPGNNSATDADTALVPRADLAIVKDDGMRVAVPGQSTLTYTITATNYGPSDVPSVVVTDAFPDVLTCSRTSSATGGATGATSGSDDLSDALLMPAASSVTWTATCTLDPGATGTVVNTATISSAEIDPFPQNDIASDETVMVPTADLVITKSAAPDPVAAGTTLRWTLELSNRGPSHATGVVASDVLPPEVGFVAASPDCRLADGVVTCTAGALAAGDGVGYFIDVVVDPAASGPISNTAVVRGSDFDPVTANNAATVGAAVGVLADLALLQTDSADPVVPGDALTWTVTVTNHGPGEAEAVTVGDAVPRGATLVATSGCAEDPAGTPVCTLGTIPAGASRHYALTVTVDPGVAGTLWHPASVTSDAVEAQPGDETSTEATAVLGTADLAVDLSGPRDAVPGEEVRYELAVVNLGPRDVVGAEVLDFLAPELIEVSWTCAATSGAWCSAGPVAGALVDAVDLAAGARVTYDITATLAPEATGTIGHTAWVRGGGVDDPNPLNDGAATSVALSPTADLRLTVANDRAEVIPGKTMAYAATVTNPGPSTSPPVRLTGSFPLTDASASCTTSAGTVCGKSVASTELDETFTVPAEESLTWTVVGTVPADAEGTLASAVALELPPDFDDPDLASNQMVDEDLVIPGEVIALGPSRRLADGGNPAVVFSGSGRSLVVFEQDDGAGGKMIRGLEIDASGVPGNDFPMALDLGLNPAVGLDPDLDPSGLYMAKQERGAYLTVWQEEWEPSAILGQLSRGGRPLGSAVELSARATAQVRPEVIPSPAGGFLVVWESTGDDAEEQGIFASFVDPAGRPVETGALRLNWEMDPAPQRPAVASDGKRFLVVWDRPGSGERRRIEGQRLTPAGDLAGPALELSDGASSQTDPTVAFDKDSGRYLVVWRQEGGAGGGIAGRVFNPAGRPQGSVFLIGTEADRNPEVSSEEGNFTVVWERPLGPRSATFGQLIDSEGRPVGNEFRISGQGTKGFEESEDGEARPAVAYAPYGAIAEAGEADVFAVIWGDRTAAEEEELRGQRYAVTADLLLAVFDDPDPLQPGSTALVYTVAVENLSTADAADVVVTHRLPEGVTLLYSEGCAEDPAAVGTCTLGTVEARSIRWYTLKTWVAPGLRGTLPLAATVSSATPDPDQADNVAAELTHFGMADLEVGLSAGAAAVAGQRAAWRLQVTNAGPSPADGTELSVELPRGVSIVASSGCGEDPSAVETCSLGTLAAGDERQVELDIEFSRVLTGAVTPWVRVASGTYDPELVSNVASAAIEVLGPGLEVELNAPARVAPGRGFPCTVTVSNAGTSGVEGLELRAALPAGLSLVGSAGCEVPGCTLGTLGPGEARQVTFEITVDAALRGIVSLGVSVVSREAARLLTASAETEVGEAEVLELVDGRFAVGVEYRNQHAGGVAGAGRAMPYSDNTGFFFFFNPDNVELLVKVLDGGAVNGNFWFFYGALTDLEYDITVTDRTTGAERRYHSPAGAICGQGDTEAFPWSKGKQQGQGVLPAGVVGISSQHHRPDALSQALPLPPLDKPGRADLSPFKNCAPGTEALCLSGGRFRVEVRWRNQHAGGVEGAGRAMAGTDDTGFFWFFDADNLELAVKVLDARAINGRFWVFYGGLSDVESWITVTDTETGASRTYHNPPGEICGGADLSAF